MNNKTAIGEEYVRWHILTAFFEGYEEWCDFCVAFLGKPSELSEFEYSDYLYGTNANIYLPLWASVCEGEKDALMNKTTWEVIRFYKKLGYGVVDIQKNPPDYIGQQCRFMEFLAARILRGETEIEREYDRFNEIHFSSTVHEMKKALNSYKPPEEMKWIVSLLIEAANRSHGEEKRYEHKIKESEWKLFPSYKWQVCAQEEVSERLYTTQVSFCDCGRKCKMLAEVQAGCVLSIRPDSSYEKKRFVGCARGHQYRQTFLSPRRLRYPMVRRGKRGEGLFRRATWNEIVEMIAEKMQETVKTYGPGSRYVMPASGVGAAVRGDRFMKDLLALTGGYLNYYNYYSCACAEHALPYVYGTDQCGSSEEEMKKTRLLILWGHNPADTIWGDAFLPNLAKAKKEGVRIVVIDPRKSDTAMQFADQWIGIRPSTDGAMADAMAYEIWNRGLQDQAFMDRYCVGFDREHMPEGVPSELNYHDYLFGLQDGVKKTAEWAEAITGVPAVTIRELAIEYAVTKPACLMPGLGPQRALNGEQNCRSFAMLACLTGNTGISGGGSGGYPNKRGYGAPSYTLRENPYAGQIPSFLWPKAAEDWTDFSAEDGLKGVRKLDSGIKMIFNLASGMMINQHSDVNRTIRILSDEKKIEMLVVSELFMTPGAKYADVLLPGTSFFETENIVPPWNASDYILYNKNTIKPLFDGRFEYEWIREVAEKMGVEEELTKGRTTSEWLKILYEVFREEEKELPEYEAFIKEGCYVFKEMPYQIAFQEQIEKGIPFQTPSGKIEIFSKRLYEMNHSEIPGIPCYVPCEEGAEDPKRKEYPLLLFGYHTKWRCHSIHDQNTYLNQVDPPVLWMHPEDAAQRKITDGEIAEIYNERGRMQIGIKVTERIVKGAVALSEGGWFTPDQDGVDKRGCINVLTMSHRSTPLAKANPQHTNLVEVKKAVTVKNVTI